jgi:hypothetical protein
MRLSISDVFYALLRFRERTAEGLGIRRTMMDFLIDVLWRTLAGGLMYWISGKCRGRNAKNAFKYAAWGFWLLLLLLLPGPFAFPLSVFNLFIKLAPSVIAFLLAATSIIKEMRAQQQGEYTDAA